MVVEWMTLAHLYWEAVLWGLEPWGPLEEDCSHFELLGSRHYPPQPSKLVKLEGCGEVTSQDGES